MSRRRSFITSTISIHALREEGDFAFARSQVHLCGFLSTPSARRATSFSGSLTSSTKISIHALREEGDAVIADVNLHEAISIHALREEGDASDAGPPSVSMNFYPRPPRGGRPPAGV